MAFDGAVGQGPAPEANLNLHLLKTRLLQWM